MYDDDYDEPEGPKSSFTTYLSEGNVHFNQGEYTKALDSYTQVNDLMPDQSLLISLYEISCKIDHYIYAFIYIVSFFLTFCSPVVLSLANRIQN